MITIMMRMEKIIWHIYVKYMILYTYSAGLLWQAQQCAYEWTDQMAGFL